MTLLAGPLKVNLTERRINAGHSLRSLARETGISATTLTRAENGDTVTPQVARAVAAFHGLRVSDVWTLACSRSGCVSTPVRDGLCEPHHEQRFDHARDAEDEQ